MEIALTLLGSTRQSKGYVGAMMPVHVTGVDNDVEVLSQKLASCPGYMLPATSGPDEQFRLMGAAWVQKAAALSGALYATVQGTASLQRDPSLWKLQELCDWRGTTGIPGRGVDNVHLEDFALQPYFAHVASSCHRGRPRLLQDRDKVQDVGDVRAGKNLAEGECASAAGSLPRMLRDTRIRLISALAKNLSVCAPCFVFLESGTRRDLQTRYLNFKLQLGVGVLDRAVPCEGRAPKGSTPGPTIPMRMVAGLMATLVLPLPLVGSEFREVAAGATHSCAWAVCWGAGDQLGLGRPGVAGQSPGQMEQLSAIDFGSGRSVRKLLAGYYVTCAWLDNGDIKCYGSSYASRASFGSTSDLSLGARPWTTGDLCPAVGEGSGYAILELGVGIYVPPANIFSTTIRHVCAIVVGGSVRCWGDNAAGNLGAEDSLDRDGVQHFLQNAVDLGGGQFATQLEVGAECSCAMLNNDTLKCWGRNDVGQLGLGHTSNVGDDGGEMGDSLPTVDLGAGRSVRQVSLGYLFGCALLDDDSLKCWGDNSVGQLGRGDTSAVGDSAGQMGDHLPAIDLGTGRAVHQVAVGHSFVCAVLDDASLKCWGSNSNGQLGLGHANNMGDGGSEMGDHLPTVDLGTGRTVIHVTAGYYHACAVLDNSAVKCWGLNDEGQLGLGHTNNDYFRHFYLINQNYQQQLKDDKYQFNQFHAYFLDIVIFDHPVEQQLDHNKHQCIQRWVHFIYVFSLWCHHDTIEHKHRRFVAQH
ncbi:HERC1 [Symbiodinium microadriaticum]|nr:HERC1 [Symbiodinium microadriaticum]